MSGDAAKTAAKNRERCHMRVRSVIYDLSFITALKPEEKYLHPLVQSFDFKNFEIKLREVIEDYANDR